MSKPDSAACCLKLCNSFSCPVSSFKISDIGHACESMPSLKGRIMLRMARVEMQVYHRRQVSKTTPIKYWDSLGMGSTLTSILLI